MDFSAVRRMLRKHSMPELILTGEHSPKIILQEYSPKIGTILLSPKIIPSNIELHEMGKEINWSPRPYETNFRVHTISTAYICIPY
jgi:hypothetical protein